MILTGTRDPVFAETLRSDLKKAHNRLTFLKAERLRYPNDAIVTHDIRREAERIDRLNVLLNGGAL